jgi:hypothetical protein
MAKVKFVIDKSNPVNKAALADLAYYKGEAELVVTDTAPEAADANILIVTLGNPPASDAAALTTVNPKAASSAAKKKR